MLGGLYLVRLINLPELKQQQILKLTKSYNSDLTNNM